MASPTTFSSLPDAYHLRKVNWQLFGTGTMRIPSKRCRILSKLIATIRYVCRVSSSRRDAERIMLFSRFENITGSLHTHFLIAGIPHHLDAKQFGLAFARQWTRHAGHCHVVSYDPTKDGVGYVTKCSTSEDRDVAEPYYSPALIRHLVRPSQVAESCPRNTTVG